MLKKMNLFESLKDLSAPTLSVEFDTPFELKNVFDGYKRGDVTFSASLIKERFLRVYRHYKKEKHKIAELDLEKDEGAKVGNLFFINPSLDLANTFVYLGGQDKAGSSRIFPLSLQDVFQYNYKSQLANMDFHWDWYANGLRIDVKDNQFSINRYFTIYGEDGHETTAYANSGQEVSGVMVSRDKAVIESFIEDKVLAQNERKSTPFQQQVDVLTTQTENFIASLQCDENKEMISELLFQIQELKL